MLLTKPKYWRTATSLKTVDIDCREWFDKVNGNSYWSASVTCNLGENNEFSFTVPIEYGYGSAGYHGVLKILVENGITDKTFERRARWNECGKRVEFTKTSCLKRDMYK